jgi:uncharacterized protein YwqG
MSQGVAMMERMTERTALEARIAQSSFRPYARELLSFASPAIELQVGEPQTRSIVGTTRAGGLPDVGPGFEWPKARSPLSFLLQVDLAEVATLPAAAPLPTSGLLSFFYDMARQPWGLSRAEHHRWRVLYTAADAPLRPVDTRPAGLTARACLPRVALRPVSIDTVPCELPLDPEDLDDLSDGDDLEDAYITEVLGPDDVPMHQMFGYPRPVQGQDFGAGPPGARWLSLLQLDSDRRLGTAFGDGGKLHWFITVDDLLDRRFEAVALSLQCC